MQGPAARRIRIPKLAVPCFGEHLGCGRKPGMMRMLMWLCCTVTVRECHQGSVTLTTSWYWTSSRDVNQWVSGVLMYLQPKHWINLNAILQNWHTHFPLLYGSSGTFMACVSHSRMLSRPTNCCILCRNAMFLCDFTETESYGEERRADVRSELQVCNYGNHVLL